MNNSILGAVPDTDLEIKGGGGEARSPKNSFWAFWASVWSKKRGGGGTPQAPPLDLPVRR